MTTSIKLGGRDFAIAALKFRDLKRILPLFLQLGIDSEAKVDAQGEIITAAIRAADGDFTRAAFDDLSPTVQELQAAITAVAELSGLEARRRVAIGDSPSGEAPAASPSSGEISTV